MTLPVEQPPQTRSEKKRAAILEAATETFRQFGFHGTSMDQVSRVANVSKRTVYNHFPSKNDLFVAVLDQIVDAGTRETLVYSPEAPLHAQLKTFASEKMRAEITPEFMGLFRAIVGDFARSPQLLAQVIPKVIIKEAQLLSWLMAAHNDGRVDIPNPGRAALQFYALLKGTLFYPVLVGLRALPTDAEREVEIDEAITMFLGRYAT